MYNRKSIKTNNAFWYNLFTTLYQRRNISKSKKVQTEVSGKKGVNVSIYQYQYIKGSNVQFRNYHNQLQDPFVIYADFVYSPKQNPNLIEIILFPLILIFIKIILLVLMVNQLVVCTADRISQSVNTYLGESIKCSIGLSKKCLKKVSIVQKLLKNT